MQEKIANINNHFKEVSFEEEDHKYTVKEKVLAYSVSGFIKKFVTPVDFESISYKKDTKLGLPKGSHKMMWKLKGDSACAKGNKAHYFGELYAFHRDLEPGDGFERAVVAFWNSLPDHIIPAFTELVMYHKTKMFGGTADIILYNTITGKFIIADYKTNEDIFSNFAGKKLNKDFSFLLETDFNKYQIQFSTYQVLFEQTGYEVENRVLVWIKPDGTFSIYETEDYTDIVKNILK